MYTILATSPERCTIWPAVLLMTAILVIMLCCCTYNLDNEMLTFFHHIGVNIWNLLRDVLEEWEILVITTVALRDGARNMINAFQQPGCYIIDIHCLIHVIQLVINGQVLSMASVKKLIELVNSIVSHAQMSNVFYAELWK